MARLAFVLVLGALAVAAQSLMFILLFPGGAAPSWVALAGWQLLAALAAALCFSNAAYGAAREYRKGLFVHAFCMCLFLPGGGQLLFLGMMLAPVLFPCSRRHIDTHVIQPPEFKPAFVSPYQAQGAVARLKRKLDVNKGVGDKRIDAMIAMRSLPLHYTGAMLAGLLSDPVEEIRLLAYGITNAAEGCVVQKIVAVSRAMEVAHATDEKARLSSELAELYWELIYQKLVQGELCRHTLERVELYARKALALDQSNASMWCLLGRCALMQQEPLQAEFFLLHARKRNFPALRVLPWMAEAAFMKRDYSSIGPMLARFRGQPLPPVLQSTVNYWT